MPHVIITKGKYARVATKRRPRFPLVAAWWRHVSCFVCTLSICRSTWQALVCPLLPRLRGQASLNAPRRPPSIPASPPFLRSTAHRSVASAEGRPRSALLSCAQSSCSCSFLSSLFCCFLIPLLAEGIFGPEFCMGAMCSVANARVPKGGD